MKIISIIILVMWMIGFGSLAINEKNNVSFGIEIIMILTFFIPLMYIIGG